MHTLLCIRDFPYAVPTIEFGSQIIQALDSEVSLLTARRVNEDPAIGQQVLKQAADVLPSQPAARIVRHGTPIDEILAETSIDRYDLFIVGTREHFSISDIFVGELAKRLAAQAKISVLVVRNPSERIENILVTDSAQHVVDPAINLAGKIAHGLAAQVTMLHVTGELPAMYTGLQTMEETLTELLQSDTPIAGNLRAHAEQLRALGVDTNIELRHGAPAEEILRAAERQNPDLIVVSGSKQYGLGLLLVDIPKELVSRAPCSVLVVHGRSS